MQEGKLNIHSGVEEYINELSDTERLKAEAALYALKRRIFESISVKQLRGPIRELRVRSHRFVFFEIPPQFYIVVAFRKNSRKTPVRHIEYAEKIYKNI
jgi:phage-related protein